jgi:ferredoxin/flavodoxin
MGNFNSADIIYFSGTGGTAKVAAVLSDLFEKNGVKVSGYELKGNFIARCDSDLLVILFPVYAANAPKPIDEWVKNAPLGDGKKAAVISVSGGGEMLSNTACRISTIKGLGKKGYDVFFEEMFIMPTNCFYSNSDVINAMLFKALYQKAGKAAVQIFNADRHRKKPYLIDRLIAKAMIAEKYAAKSFGKNLSANDNCTGCEKCAEDCPRNNITIKNSSPVFGKNCVICLRCIYLCPQKAIVPKRGKSLLIKEGYDLEAIEEKTKNITCFPPAGEVAKGFLYKGLRKYLEEENM